MNPRVPYRDPCHDSRSDPDPHPDRGLLSCCKCVVYGRALTVLPLAAPAIITTPPTFMDTEHEDHHSKKRSRLQQFSLRRRSFDPASVDRPGGLLRKSMDKKRSGPLGMKKSKNDLLEDHGDHRERSSTSQPRPEEPGLSLSETRDFAESAPALAPPTHRASESSRGSDGSSGGHVSFETNARPAAPQRIGSTRFGFGRRKQRASLFPLPMKIEPPSSQTPRLRLPAPPPAASAPARLDHPPAVLR